MHVKAVAVQEKPVVATDWAATAAQLDLKSPLEIMDHVSCPCVWLGAFQRL